MPLWRRLLSHGPRDYMLFAEAILTLAEAAMVVAWMPFRHIVGHAQRAPRQPRQDGAGIFRVQWAVRAAARHVPWRAKCFEQGLAAQHMLRRRGVAATLHYGVATQRASLIAHVWVTSGATSVIGGENAQDFCEIARFGAVAPDGGDAGASGQIEQQAPAQPSGRNWRARLDSNQRPQA